VAGMRQLSPINSPRSMGREKKTSPPLAGPRKPARMTAVRASPSPFLPLLVPAPPTRAFLLLEPGVLTAVVCR
jgi:hypothetical protein